MPDPLLGALLAFAIAALTAPVGVSGAVFLVPVQVSVLKVPNPAITPTNLVYNLVAIPGALYAYHREGRLAGRLTALLAAGSLPGVILGAVIRVELLSSAEAFYFVIAAVLIPLGVWLAFFRPATGGEGRASDSAIVAASFLVGVVGGIYGIGGGSVLAPLLVGVGFSVVQVAPAALAATFVTSIAGVATYGLLSIGRSGEIAPDWLLGIAMGVGGLAGSYLGARFQSRLPESVLRRGLGLLALALGARYLFA